MNNNPIQGKTIQFTFSDGPMAKKSFEHEFQKEGVVAYHEVGGEAKSGTAKESDRKKSKPSEAKYEVAAVREDVCAVSYLGAAGYTLTAVLDLKTKKLVAFSSNDKMLGMQHGTFEEVPGSHADQHRSRA